MKQYRIDPSKGMEFGLYTLGDHVMNPIQWRIYQCGTTYSRNN